ncbi:VOC family protein [Dyadobacter fermentans]|uniref:Glyoxalase/bleomycin resistance protein/dioxygenase n=1 Tax=Dyadobacter fermentans (strain ATCC 700827 / DSM 18053 / CIP 107007 / KCTC 52180 / NS114) TaxID=471854 RepID=C6VX55_DYAFD|nr:VOC family protein [Dyadobacter fermentans]ACT91528.1 Glyoxalase/bleomycin resistance protein/dioxygenase [Dyadobacter fermentans DSM 18053]
MKINFKRLDHIMLCIPPGTEQQARDFYGGVLGLPELTDLGYPLPHGAIWFQMGDIQLHIRAEEVHDLSQRHPAFEVHDLEAARAVLEQHGVAVKNESKIPDRNRFSFRDPFGNRIELIEMIA